MSRIWREEFSALDKTATVFKALIEEYDNKTLEIRGCDREQSEIEGLEWSDFEVQRARVEQRKRKGPVLAG